MHIEKVLTTAIPPVKHRTVRSYLWWKSTLEHTPTENWYCPISLVKVRTRLKNLSKHILYDFSDNTATKIHYFC